MTTAEAAEVLSVSVRQVQHLVRARRIAVRGTAGRSVLLDSASVRQQRIVGSARGRTWTPATVWLAMAVLDGRKDLTAGLSTSKQSQLSHLRQRLRRSDPETVVRMSRGRARTTQWRVTDAYARKVREQAVVTAGSALDNHDGSDDLARSLGLGSRASDGRVDGYATADTASRLQQEFFMAADPTGNVTLRVVDDIETLADRAYAFRACLPVVALDLAGSLDARERAAGLRALGALIGRL